MLQSLDTALFRFINGTLQNAVFDQVMPILAGGPWFFGALLVLGGLWWWRGNLRARCYLTVLALVLIAGDVWITRTLKDAISRPRPCLSLESVNLPLKKEAPKATDSAFAHGCSETGSMPSGHTTGWFAALMVTSLYYRRAWRFLLPLACAVGFSRVYNGVHYPSDVLAGAVLGAGYGLALSFGLDRVWRWVVGGWFPRWASLVPSLLPGRTSAPSPAFSEVSLDTHWLRLGWLTIGLLFVSRLCYLASGRIELSEDEAYQWLWSKHLALSYFSKPPLIAYVQWLGTHLFGDNAFGVRFFSPVCAAVGSLAALHFFARHVSARAGFWMVAVCNLAPLLAVGSTLMTVDPLLVVFWTLAMFTGWKAVQPEGRLRDWALAGLWMGLAFLSKYTALFQWLSWALFFVLWKPARTHLRRPGPYLALLVNALCSLPVLIWNAQHDWITAAHVAGDAKLDETWKFDPGAPLEFLGGTAGLLHPIFFVATIWAATALWRRYPQNALLRFFFSMGAPVYVFHGLYTLHSPVQLNWIAASVIPLFCLMVAFWELREREGVPHLRAWLATAVVIGLAAVAILHETQLIRKFTGFALPAKADPLRRVRGWKETAEIVSRERAKLQAEGRPVFVIGGHYGITGLLSFYTPEARTNVAEQPFIYYRYMPVPKTQFYLWPSYVGTRRGQNALFVQEKDKPAPAPPDMTNTFASVTEVGRFPVRHAGQVIHTIQIFACRDLQR